jgi:predicted Zn-dependent protease
MTGARAKNQCYVRPGSIMVKRGLAGIVVVVAMFLPIFWGCMPSGPGGHEGPGHRRQSLQLTPSQELSLGRQAAQEIKNKAEEEGTLLRSDDPLVQEVRRVGERIKKAAYIEPLQREINYDVKNYYYDWNFYVIKSKKVNAYCLPACEVFVYTGLLQFVDKEDELAAVLGHEVAHALAHHASERLAREGRFHQALEAVGGKAMSKLDPRSRKRIIDILGGGVSLFTRSYDREQESEADHIGVFLMTFAGYDPDEAIRFWEKMARASQGREPPEILSTHPSNNHRIYQLKKWVPYARAALEAYKTGNIKPKN